MLRILRSSVARNVVIVVVTGGLTILGWWQSRPRTAPPDDWEVSDLVAHVNDRGVKVRAIPVMEKGPPSQGVYFTTTARTWGQLNTMPMVPECIKEWEG